MEGLYVKCLLYSDDQFILALANDLLQYKCHHYMNESYKANNMKVNARKMKAIVTEMDESVTECSIAIDD